MFGEVVEDPIHVHFVLLEGADAMKLFRRDLVNMLDEHFSCLMVDAGEWLTPSVGDTPFFEKPILNSPYEFPARHWELDDNGQPTNKIVENRRVAEFITPVPKPKKQRRSKKQKEREKQKEMVFDE